MRRCIGIAALALALLFVISTTRAQLFYIVAAITTKAGNALTTLGGVQLTPLNAAGQSETFQSFTNSINVFDYGAKCNGSTDDTVAIQTAIDAAYTANIQTVLIPANCKATPPLFLDAPGNLRGADGTHGAAYSAGTTYSLGQTANALGIGYISLVNSNTGNTPASSPSDWQVYIYNSGTTYTAGAVVGYKCATCYEATPWISLQGSNTGNTPALGSAYWQSWSATPINFSFSMCLIGGLGAATRANTIYGGTLTSTSNTAPYVWVGPGQNMCVKNLGVRGPASATRGEQPPNGVAVAISGGNGGAVQTVIENVLAENAYYCFQAGANVPMLGENNTFKNAACSNAYSCFDFEGQSDQNLIINSNATCTIGVHGSDAVQIIGGEWGLVGNAAAPSISSISSVTSAACTDRSGLNCYSWSFTVASPDSGWPSQSFTFWASGTTYAAGNIVSFQPNSQNGDASKIILWQSLQSSNTGNAPGFGSAYWIPAAGQGLYNSFSIVTTGFGVIPVLLTGWNAGTGVATVTTYTPWVAMYLHNIAALSATDFQTEVQAATSVYAAERSTVFYGTNLDAGSIWMQPGSPSCITLLDVESGTPGITATINHPRFDYDLGWTSFGPSHSPTSAALAAYYCQHSFPFIYQEPPGGGIALNNFSTMQQASSDSIILDISNPNISALTAFNANLFAPTIRTGGGESFTAVPLSGGTGAVNYTAALGSFEWNIDPFLPHGTSANGGMLPYQVGSLASPFSGFVPARYGNPRATTAFLADWNSPGALGSYPPMAGNVPYGVMNWNSGTLTHLWAVSAHDFFSYGQNLTTSNIGGLSWSYVGQTQVVTLDSGSISWMFPGLVIGLNNGSGNVNYIVTGVEPGLGYITVFSLASDAYSATNLLAGTAGTTYTGTTITEQAYSITQY